MTSLPLWERGLKWTNRPHLPELGQVAPLVGAWIEITILKFLSKILLVAPLVGAWIEIEIHRTERTGD